MSQDPLFHQKFPIGKYKPPPSIEKEHLVAWIEQIETLPSRVEKVVALLSEEQLDTPYRQGGWTVRQVIHHIPDSHLNSYIRFKWALTEDNPTIKAYDEGAWANLPDTKNESIQSSLELLKSIHAKLATLFKSMSSAQMKRTFVHPQSGKQITLDWNIGAYAWHGEHHLQHIKSVLL